MAPDVGGHGVGVPGELEGNLLAEERAGPAITRTAGPTGVLTRGLDRYPSADHAPHTGHSDRPRLKVFNLRARRQVTPVMRILEIPTGALPVPRTCSCCPPRDTADDGEAGPRPALDGAGAPRPTEGGHGLGHEAALDHDRGQGPPSSRLARRRADALVGSGPGHEDVRGALRRQFGCLSIAADHHAAGRRRHAHDRAWLHSGVTQGVHQLRIGLDRLPDAPHDCVRAVRCGLQILETDRGLVGDKYTALSSPNSSRPGIGLP